MTESTIPVDLRNPGQVFACLGLLEAADLLHGGAVGAFAWPRGHDTRFHLTTNGSEDPVRASVAFLADPDLDVTAMSPNDWWPGGLPHESDDPREARKIERLRQDISQHTPSDVFPCATPNSDTALPVRIEGRKGCTVTFQHWADGSGRNSFKLYSGNRSALDIMQAMILGTEDTCGLRQLWESQPSEIMEHPFDVLTRMRGSFNLDPRGGWTALDVGYSLDKQEYQIAASPLVEVFAAWGMEHARPRSTRHSRVRLHGMGNTAPCHSRSSRARWRHSRAPHEAVRICAGSVGQEQGHHIRKRGRQ